jgi:hypothetical protein
LIFLKALQWAQENKDPREESYFIGNVITSRLRGDAITNIEIPHTFEALDEHVRKGFLTNLNPEAQERNLYRTRQNGSSILEYKKRHLEEYNKWISAKVNQARSREEIKEIEIIGRDRKLNTFYEGLDNDYKSQIGIIYDKTYDRVLDAGLQVEHLVLMNRRTRPEYPKVSQGKPWVKKTFVPRENLSVQKPIGVQTGAPTKTCTNCKKVGHSIETCFFLNFPGQCHLCKKEGHKKSECPELNTKNLSGSQPLGQAMTKRK